MSLVFTASQKLTFLDQSLLSQMLIGSPILSFCSAKMVVHSILSNAGYRQRLQERKGLSSPSPKQGKYSHNGATQFYNTKESEPLNSAGRPCTEAQLHQSHSLLPHSPTLPCLFSILSPFPHLHPQNISLTSPHALIYISTGWTFCQCWGLQMCFMACL